MGFAFLQDLQRRVQEIWQHFDQTVIDKLVSDFRRRPALVLRLNDESISGLLSAHMSEPPPQMIEELKQIPPRMTFSDVDDRRILALYAQLTR